VPVDERRLMRRDLDLEDAHVFVLEHEMVMRFVFDRNFEFCILLRRSDSQQKENDGGTEPRRDLHSDFSVPPCLRGEFFMLY
jgi:hypothetical protein